MWSYEHKAQGSPWLVTVMAERHGAQDGLVIVTPTQVGVQCAAGNKSVTAWQWIPAFAGMTSKRETQQWIPAFAGMTKNETKIKTNQKDEQ